MFAEYFINEDEGLINNPSQQTTKFIIFLEMYVENEWYQKEQYSGAFSAEKGASTGKLKYFSTLYDNIPDSIRDIELFSDDWDKKEYCEINGIGSEFLLNIPKNFFRNENENSETRRFLEATRKFLTRNINSFIPVVDYLYGKSMELGLFGFLINKKKAFHYYQMATFAQFPAATYYLARCYEKGIGTVINMRKSLDMYRAACKLGYQRALYKYGLILITHGDNDLGINYIKQATAVNRKSKTNTSMFLKPIFHLATLYNVGYGDSILRDTKYAVKLFEKGSDLGCKHCMYKTAEYYSTCSVALANKVKAFKLYNKSMQSGQSDSITRISQIFLQMPLYNNNREMFQSKTSKIGYDLSLKAAISGNIEAIYQTAKCLYFGIGTEQDLILALWWFQIITSECNLGSQDLEIYISNIKKILKIKQ